VVAQVTTGAQKPPAPVASRYQGTRLTSPDQKPENREGQRKKNTDQINKVGVANGWKTDEFFQVKTFG